MYRAAHQQLAACTGDCGWPRRIPRGSAVEAQPAISIDKPTGIGAGARARLAAAAAGRGERPAGRWVNRRWSYQLETAPLYRKRHFSLKRRSLSVVVGELLEARRAAVEHAEQRKSWQQNFETRPDSFYSGSTQRYRYCARELRCAAGSLASGLSLLAHRSRLLHSSRRLATAFACTSSRSPCSTYRCSCSDSRAALYLPYCCSEQMCHRAQQHESDAFPRARASVARSGRPASPVPSSSRCCPARLRPALGLIWEPDAAVAAHYLCEHARREQIRECHPLQRVQQREQREQRGKELEATRRTAARAGDE